MAKKTTMTWDEVAIEGKLGATINPGDKCWTFTGVYGGRSISVNSGIFRGVRSLGSDGRWEAKEYIVERKDGSLARIHYPYNIAAADLTLEQLDGGLV